MRKQIRNLLVVTVGSFVVTAVSILMVAYYYGPNGGQRLNNVLLTPDLLPRLSYAEKELGSTVSNLYVFDRLEYHYYVESERQWKTTEVSLDSYRQFFQIVDGAESLAPVPDNVSSLFMSNAPSRLLVKVMPKGESHNDDVSRTFQEISFSNEGNHFRVDLRQSGQGREWAYFRHADIRRRITLLFVKEL